MTINVNYVVINNIILMKFQLSQLEKYKDIVNELNLNIVGRKWATTFNTPEDEVFRRLPILLNY